MAMDNERIKLIEFKIQDLIALRTGYNAVIIVLTGGLVGLFYNIMMPLNIALFIIGLLLDLLFLTKAQQMTKQIHILCNELEK